MMGQRNNVFCVVSKVSPLFPEYFSYHLLLPLFRLVSACSSLEVVERRRMMMMMLVVMVDDEDDDCGKLDENVGFQRLF